jgi:integrase
MKGIDLRSKSSRKPLAPNQNPYFESVHKGVHLGFRRAPGTLTETWLGRYRVNGKYVPVALGAVTKDFDHREAVEALLAKVKDAQANPEPTDKPKLRKVAINPVVPREKGAPKRKKGDTVEREEIKLTVTTVWDLVLVYIDQTYPSRLNPNWEAESTKRARQVVFEQPIGKVRLTDVRARHITALQRDLRKEGMSGASVNRATTILRAALNWGLVEEYLTHRPLAGVKRLPEATVKRKKFRPADCVEFIKGAPESLQPILSCMFYTACRPVAARRLQVQDVDLDGGVITFKSLKGSDNENFKTYSTHIAGAGLEFFRNMVEGRDPEEYVFLSATGVQWAERNLAKAISGYRSKKGLDKEWDAYSFRHAIISHNVNQGMAESLAADQYGTSLQYIHENYFEADPAQARQFAGRHSL